jgi:hypothetical protein
MGTRSVTIILDDDQEVVRIYRQYDGYPEGHGLDLAKLCNVTIVNGYSGNGEGQANGPGCLAASIVAGLKDGIGNVYLEPTGGEISDWIEYVYIVRVGVPGSISTIECSTQSGPFPFNLQADKLVFEATRADKLVKKLSKKKSVA